MAEIIERTNIRCIKDTHTVSAHTSKVYHSEMSNSCGRHSDGYQAYAFFAFEEPDIPNNAIIVSAMFHGYVENRLLAKDYVQTIRPCSGAWAEDTLTYATMPTSSGVTAQITLGDSRDFFAADITSIAQSWFDGSYNYANGFYITSSESTSYKRIYTRNATTDYQPYIDITYYVPASKPTFEMSSTDIVAGIKATIQTNRMSDGYTHTLGWKLVKASGVSLTGQIATNIGASTTWTVNSMEATSMLEFLSDVTSATLYITCKTDDETGTSIGEEISSGVTMHVPSDVVPKISGVVVTGINTLSGYLVQSVSGANIDVSASGANGSTISKYAIRLDNVTYTTNPANISVFTQGGTKTVTVTVTDTRNRTATTTKDIVIYTYAAPQITNIFVERSNSTGTEASIDGEYLRFTLAAMASRIYSNTLNRLTVQVYTKLRTDNNWILVNTYTNTTYDVSYSNYVLSGVYSNLNSYDVRFDIVDTVGTITQWQTQIGTQNVLINFDPDTMRIKFGGVAESDDPSNTVIFGMAVKFLKDMILNDNRTLTTVLNALDTRDDRLDEKIDFMYDDTFDAITSLGQRIIPLESESEHVITSAEMDSRFTVYESGYEPIVRRVGKLVQMDGVVKPTSSISGSVTEYTMFTLPEEYWPKQLITILCQGSTYYQWQLTITAMGEVRFSRYRAGSSYSSASTTAQLSFHAVWIAAEYSGGLDDRLYDSAGNILSDSIDNEIEIDGGYVSRYTGQRIDTFIGEVN